MSCFRHNELHSSEQVSPNASIFQSCCPTVQDSAQLETSFRKQKKFISLSKDINKTQQSTPNKSKAKMGYGVKESPYSSGKPRGQFQEDKQLFLSQIRSYTPQQTANTSYDIKVHLTDETANSHSFSTSSPERHGHPLYHKTRQNNLSNVLENLNSELFSDLLVAENVKGKIIMSNSLGSIAEVRSDMQVSMAPSHCPSRRATLITFEEEQRR